MKIILAGVLMLVCFSMWGLGTKDIDVNGKGISLSFNKAGGGRQYNNFMRYGCEEEERLYLSLVENETVYFGFQFQTGVLRNTPIATQDIWVRIRSKDNDNIVMPATEIIQGNAGYIATRLEADNGPNELTGVGGYDALTFVAPSTGDFYMEVGYSTGDGSIDQFTEDYFLAPLFDITVINESNEEETGRVWSKAWHLFAEGGFTPDGALNAQQYIYTDDGLISRLNYNGIIPYQYILISNSTGSSATGDFFEDRKSILSDFGEELIPQYKLFFDEPDTSIFRLANLDSLFGALNEEITVTGCPGDYCININVNRQANANLLMDLNGVAGYQENTNDLLFEVELEEGENCIPWDGIDGIGQQIVSAEIQVDIEFVAGVTHLPMYDVEMNDNGVSVDFIYPKSIAGRAQIYWDDSNFPGGEVNDIDGCSDNCHAWADFYGDVKIINSWWYVTKEPISSALSLTTFSFDVGSDKEVCEGDTLELQGLAGQQAYSWTPNTANIINEDQQNASVFPTEDTYYKLRITRENGCEYEDSLLVVVNDKPSLTTTANPVDFCLGTSSTLEVNGANNYVWLDGNTTNFQKVVNPTFAGDTSYQVVGTNDKGCIDTTSITITVYDLPTITILSDTLCEGESVTLNATGGTNYLWKNNTVGLSATNISNPNANPIETTTYTIEVTDANNCVSEEGVVIVVNELPTVTTLDASICLNESAQLSANGGVDYLWKNNTIGLSATNISNPNASPTETTTYTVEVTDANNCVSEKDVVVTVNDLPDPQFIDFQKPVCPNEEITYQVSGMANSSFSWQVTPIDGITGIVPNNEKADITFSGTEGFVEIQVEETTEFGCVAIVVDQVEIDNKVAIDFQLIDEICEDEAVFVLDMALPKTGGEGIYTYNGEEIDSIIPADLPKDVNLTIEYKFETDKGCFHSETQEIIIHSNPIISFADLPNKCTDSGVLLLNYATPEGGTYTGIGVANNQFIPSTTGLVIDSLNEISYEYEDDNGCVSFAKNTIQVNAVPSVEILNSIVVCEGETGKLISQTTDNELSYKWYLDGNPLNIGGTELEVYEEGSYQVEVDRRGCTFLSSSKEVDIATNSVTVTEDQTILYGEQATLGGNVFTNLGQDYTVQWTNSEGEVSQNINTTFSGENTDNYVLTVTDEYGCTSQDQLVIEVLNPVLIPNGFSPNGDDLNEEWIIQDIEDYPEALVKVFNRWGDVVYVTYGYLNDWDGTKDGEPLPNATYYYVVELNFRDLEYAGSVTIVR
ncbi:MAG: gliding motility-associated C-terminal domain-containing protein [Cytophagales bacterium]|nr:gliding motility-associated C-terminal domain-containing protein [Cytophagales bacterium]